jgi:predicted DNA-binding protein with PD1-like motif
MEVINKSKNYYVLRLEYGEELREQLEKFCKAQKVSAAWVNALGSSKELELAYYNLEKKKYETKSLREDLEITGVTGNVAIKDGSPFIHIHGTFSNRDMQVVGGHINRCVVSATCEVSIWSAEGKMGRKYDEFTGLHLLCKL